MNYEFECKEIKELSLLMGIELMILGSSSVVFSFQEIGCCISIASLYADHLTQDNLQLRVRDVVDEFLVKESHP